MKKWILTLLLSVGTIASAANLPKSFDVNQWNNLQARIQKDGKPLETEAGTYMSLTHIAPADVTKAHQSEYMSDVGYNVNGKYNPYMVSVVSEKWALTSEGDWDVDQWLYAASVEGELTRVYHIHIVEAQDRMVKDYGVLPVPALSSPEMIEQWEKVLNPWLSGTY